MEIYINEEKYLYDIILRFVDYTNDIYDEMISEKYFRVLTRFLKFKQIKGDREEMQQFLEMIKNISDHHHRNRNFINKIKRILQFYKDQIKQTLSNIEIFHIFKSNKIILLFLLKNRIITISETIYNEMINKIESNGNRYCYFFYPEIQNFIGEESMQKYKNELLLKNPNFFGNFEYNREEGENDSYICSLIRQDSVEEFIKYSTRTNYPLSSKISPSIFETNSFLIENKNTTLIEYSAFFGSIQIFQYLMMNNVELKPSLWLYTIHSKNAEMIHLLESNQISPPTKSKIINDFNLNNGYIKCLIESIKCHHNDIADYIENCLLIQNRYDSQKEEKISLKSIKYHNYEFLDIEDVTDHDFFYLCFHNYNKLVNLLIKNKEKEMEAKII